MNYIVYIKNLGFMRYSKIILLGFLLNFVNMGEAISSSSISNYSNNESLFYNSCDNVQQSGEVTLQYCSQDNKIIKLYDTDEKNTSENNILIREKTISNIINNTHYFKFKSQENLNKVKNMDCAEHAESSTQIYDMMLVNDLKCNFNTHDNYLSNNQQNNKSIQSANEKLDYIEQNSRKSTCISPTQNNSDPLNQDCTDCSSQLLVQSQNNTNTSNNETKLEKKHNKNTKKNKGTGITKKSLKHVKNVNKPSKFIDVTKLKEANNLNIRINKNNSILKDTDLVLLQNLIQWKHTNNNSQINNKLYNDKENIKLKKIHNANTNMNHILIKHGAFEINYVKEQVKQLLSNCYKMLYPSEVQNINDNLISDKLIDDIITEIHVSGRNINQEKVKDLLNKIKDSIYPDKNVEISSNALYSFLNNVNEYLYYFYSSKPLLKEQLIKYITTLLQKTKLQDGDLINDIYTYIYNGRSKIVSDKITDELKRLILQIFNKDDIIDKMANNITNKISNNFLA